MPSPRGGVARVRSQQRRERHAVQLGHGRVLLGAREVEERRGQVDVLRLRARDQLTSRGGDNPGDSPGSPSRALRLTGKRYFTGVVLAVWGARRTTGWGLGTDRVHQRPVWHARAVDIHGKLHIRLVRLALVERRQ